MAYVKYLYFAKRARDAGAVDIAHIFEEAAAQDIIHIFAELDLLYPKDLASPAEALEIAIAGDTFAYTEMYPKIRNLALAESRHADADFPGQIDDSKQHATDFKRILEVAAKYRANIAKMTQ